MRDLLRSDSSLQFIFRAHCTLGRLLVHRGVILRTVTVYDE